MLAASLDRRMVRVGVAGSFVLTLIACVEVVVARLTRGDVPHVGLASALFTFAALVCVTSLLVVGRGSEEPSARNASLVTGHAIGATLAFGAVHVFHIVRGTRLDSALVEGPAQLVNDLVLVGVTLGLCWSLAHADRLVRLGFPFLLIGLLAAYRATAAYWHVDSFSGFGVQSFVARQAFATAGALVLFDILRPRSSS
ncbi:MAG: hypothetical protein HOV80_28575 [Polyangiaceae bacterium]|nr:hypothetical protein [Polyangiaceae bacterium]